MSDASISGSTVSDAAGERTTTSAFSATGCLKSVSTILILTLLLPITTGATCLSLIAGLLRITGDSKSVGRNGKSVMLTGGKMTKALQLARLFHRSGYRVVFCETAEYRFTAHRFSNSVDRFEIVPRPGDADYANVLCEIAQRESIDFFVPVSSPVSSLFDSQAKVQLEQHCRVIHVSAEHIETLDNKFLFAQSATEVDLPVPMTVRITDPQQVIDFDFNSGSRPFILKSIAYDPVRRLDLRKLPMESLDDTKRYLATLPISESNPWILQEFIQGQEFCTHSTVIDGDVRVHVCCQSSAFQVNYDPIEIPSITQWIDRFCQHLKPTGQLSFDFIKADDDGRFYAIECNPRTHSAITAFYANENFAEAWFDDQWCHDAITPNPRSRPTYWMAHEFYRIANSILRLDFATIINRLKIIAVGKEAVFDVRDPLPFLMLHHFHVPQLLIKAAVRGHDWVRIDFNIGKLVRAGGD